MELPFTHRPGRRERHLRRRHGNPLFGWPPVEVRPEDLLAAQKSDHAEMASFDESFPALVQKVVELPPNAGSDQVLGLEGELERHYEQACSLPGDHTREKDAICKLVDLIMSAVRRAAGDDPLAQRELQDGEDARAIHFRLLSQPLAADILHPEMPIPPDDLMPALLTATQAEIDAALEIFGADEIGLLLEQGTALLAGLEAAGVQAPLARARLESIQAAIVAIR